MDGVLLTLGSINADFQVRLERPLDNAETSKAHDLLRLSGGKAANVAYVARMLGREAWLFGCIGEDDLAEQALNPLRKMGVDLGGVHRVEGAPSGLAMVMVPPNGKKHIVVANNANDIWAEEAKENVCRRISSAPPGSVLAVNCEVPADVAKAAIAAAGERGFAIVLDPSYPERVDTDMLALLSAITPNESEARDLRGICGCDSDDLEDIARALAERGPDVCVKLEDGGCLLIEAQSRRRLRIPAASVDVVDTTGAGDAFTGAFAVALLDAHPLERACHFAVAASTLAVTAYGSQPSYSARNAIEAQMRKQGFAETPTNLAHERQGSRPTLGY